MALTRAEDRLIVCGWEPRKGLPDRSWYELVRRGFTRLDATAEPSEADWGGDIRVYSSPQHAEAVVAKPALDPGNLAPLPAWAGNAPHWIAATPREEPALPSPLAPSRPENASLGPVPHAASPLAERDATGTRFRRGQLVHTLLQHLPTLMPQHREDAALAYLAQPGHGLDTAQAANLVAEILTVLDHPTLAPLFGPEGRAEVPLTGVVAGNVIGGLVDRLAVLPDAVLVADYKTNRDPPATPDTVPVLYLRQMAAYRAVLRVVFPGRAVSCALVWTIGAHVMPLPDSLLDRHAPGANTPRPA